MSSMAAVVTEAAVEHAASAADFLAGRELQSAGAVSAAAAAYGGVGGFVTDGGTQFDVWVGVQGRTLVGECDCPAASPDGLCVHGTALALDAVAAGIGWGGSRPVAGGALGSLTPADKGRVLDALLRDSPELRSAAERLATALLDASPAGAGS
jgi:uncharacterized Zn finger protein